MSMSDEETKKIFAKKLKYYMDLNSKRQIDVANYLGCSPSLIHAWIYAQKMPRVDSLSKLCAWFHIEMSDLLTDTQKEQEDGYYLNEETKKIAQAIYDNPDMRSLFDMSSKMSPDRLKAHLEFMKRLQDSEL